jgi:ribosomal protein S18 acetylase RimI-like enzyme
VNVREATAADRPQLEELVAAYLDEHWARPYAPPPPAPYLESGRIVVAEEDGEIVGLAKSDERDGLGHISLVYLKPEARGKGGGNELLRELVTRFREQGFEHVSLNVELPNDEALAYWRRLGFTDYRRSLLTGLEALEKRLDGSDRVTANGSIHVQTDDLSAVEKAVARWVPRVVRSPKTVVSAPRNGWIGVYDEVAETQPEHLRKLASELSYVSGGVVIALSIEQGDVVRLVAFDRGRMADEYLSVPEYYGPLPPGDAIALRANPTLLGRLTGAKPGDIRAAAPTAVSPAELAPADELLAGLAWALGIEGAGLRPDDVATGDGAVTVEHAS